MDEEQLQEMRDDAAALATRIESITEYLEDSPDFDFLSEKHKELMYVQRHTMKQYLNILLERLAG